MLVADDERFPLRGRRNRGGAAEVEYLGLAGDNDAAERAVAQQQFEEVGREVPASTELGASLDECAIVLVEVHDRADVRLHAMALAELSSIECLATEVGERVHPAGAGGALVGRLTITDHLRLERRLR